MNSSTNPRDESKADPPLAPPQSPLPTQGEIASTAPQTQSSPTHSFHPTVPTQEVANLAGEPIVQIDSTVDGYEILEQIGRGGMGIVFKARQPGTGQIVALKMIREGVFADDESLARFRQEIETLGRVHPRKNIVPIYHVGQYKGHSYYVMPFLSRGSAAQNLNQYRDNIRDAVSVVEKIARAVHQLHENQILHRDIKPGNILLDADGEPYLSDFGLIKQLDADQSLTHTHQRLGTPAYMAPEQTGLVMSNVSPATDIWALGVVLYEMLTGSRPFVAPKGEETTTLLLRIVQHEPPRPRKLVPGLDAGLEAVILKCLEKIPADRFTSAKELADELARWLEHGKVQTRRTPFRRFLYRNRWIAAALALFAVTVAVAADWRRRNTPDYVHDTIRSELIDMEAVTLVSEKGPPRWHGDPLESGMVAYVDAAEGYWMIESWKKLSLIELLRDIPFDEFKLRAEIRHDKTNAAKGFKGQVGIFVGFQDFKDEQPPRQFWCELMYNDLVSVAPPPIPKLKAQPGNPVEIRYRLRCNEIDVPQGWTKAGWFELAGIKANRWRTLELEFRRKTLEPRFDNNALMPLTRDYANEQFTLLLRSRRDSIPNRYGPLGQIKDLQLSPRGSIGILVADSTVAVKNVTLTHISEP